MRAGRAAPAAALLLAACAQAPLAPGPAAPPLSLEKCGIANLMEPLLCGDLAVPENRAVPAGRTITLSVVVIPAVGERTLPPLYDFEGGPGIPATSTANFWTGDGARYREHRDIVLIDARGTGASHALTCPLYTANPYVAVLDDQDTGDCRDKLAEDADLSQYSTAATVQDIDAVRAALGHERIDLIGLSYGTRTAQEYLRAYPQRVRAMVLLGALSPAERLPLSFSRDASATLQALAAQCAADVACRKAVPDLAADLATLGRKFKDGKLTITRPDGRKGVLLEGPFWEAVRAQLVSVRTQRELPWQLHEAARKRWTPLLTAIAPKPDRTALGLLLSVSCPEDTLRIEDAEAAGAAAGVFGAYRLEQQRRACRIWGVPAASTPREFVESKTPTLILAGEMDGVTPPRQARQIAEHLPNARVVVIPNLGHFPDGLTHLECYDGLAIAFLAAGSAANLDTSCIASMQPPPFRVK